ncbi:pilus assembly protein PilY [Dyella jiangningensis]|nr:pilus assembly protein PilY [Dyella jiangningensis]
MTLKRSPLSRLLSALACSTLLLTLPGLALGDDIDLYTGAPANGGKPNVLLAIDNAAAWDATVSIPAAANCPSWITGTKDADFIRCGLYKAVTGLGTNPLLAGKINMGLMMFALSPLNGGQFYYPANTPPTPPGALPLMDATGVAGFQSAIQNNLSVANKSNSNKVDEEMQEVWAYFAGKQGLSGTNYNSPLQPCQKSFVIYIANAVNNNDPKTPNGTPPSYTALQSAGATSAQLTTITIPPPYKNANKGNADQGNWADEWTRFMYQTDLSNGTNVNKQNIVTYTIAMSDGSNPDYVQFVGSMASNGGGKAFVIDVTNPGALDQLVADLTQIFNEVQAVNSVFASVSLPVSVNGQGSYLNQIYVGMFRPDANGLPRWMGNLKQYQLGFTDSTNTSVQMEDANGQPAISSAGTGFVSPNATSFWTSDTSASGDGPFLFTSNSMTTNPVPNWPTAGFWSAPASTNAPAPASGVGGAYDAPDGEVVEKGGVGESMRIDYLVDQTKRTVYTCSTVSNCVTTFPMESFATGNTSLSGTALGSATTTPTVANLINWVRGTDNAGNETEPGPGGLVTVRPSIHGDVLHSRPAVVNYGGTTGVVVFYGSNDGMFHAINGNKPSTDVTAPQGIGGVRPGGELWSFVAPEFFGKFQRLYNNNPKIKLYGSTDPTATPKDYFFDGTATVYQDLRVANNPKVYIFLSARRGGRFVYAFDVTIPTKPKFVWKITNTDIAELGQTWSQPKVALVKGYTNPVIIMGGGYDPAEDSDPAPAADTQGRAIVVLDALTGSVVWTASPSCPTGSTTCKTVTGMTRSIPADITLLDRNSDGYIDRLYAADVGGNIWRVDLEPNGATAPSGWAVSQIASLGGTGNNARKFFYPPDVTPTSTFDAVTAASGDREHPLYSSSTTAGTAYNVVNRFYMLRDTNTGTTVANNWTPITEATLTDETGASGGGSVAPYSITSTTSGFYVTLNHTGEKAVNAPLTVAGYTYFGTNTPDVIGADSTKCYPNLGIARGYAINFLTGVGLNSDGFVVFSGGGFPPSPVFGLISIGSGSSSVITPVLIGGGNQTSPSGGNNTSVLGAQKITPPQLGKRKRTYWFIEGVK